MNKLFYIRGSKINPEGCKQALLEQYPKMHIDSGIFFDRLDYLYFCSYNECHCISSIYSKGEYDIVSEYGSEILPKVLYMKYDCNRHKECIDLFTNQFSNWLPNSNRVIDPLLDAKTMIHSYEADICDYYLVYDYSVNLVKFTTNLPENGFEVILPKKLTIEEKYNEIKKLVNSSKNDYPIIDEIKNIINKN